jgi:hypothetical protein
MTLSIPKPLFGNIDHIIRPNKAWVCSLVRHSGGLLIRRSRVQIPSGPFLFRKSRKTGFEDQKKFIRISSISEELSGATSKVGSASLLIDEVYQTSPKFEDEKKSSDFFELRFFSIPLLFKFCTPTRC